MTAKAYAKGSLCPKQEKGILRIYGMRFCPYVKRVLLVLAAKDIPHEVININLASKPDWFIEEKNSSGKVPVLEKEGKIIKESIIISKYLDEVYPGRKLSPEDPDMCAREQMAITEFGKIEMNILTVMESQFYSELKSFDSTVKDALREYEKELSNNKFFGGDKPGMWDYMIWPWFEYIVALISESEYPHFIKWIHNMRLDPAAKKVAIPQNIYASYVKTKLNAHPNYDIGLDS